MIRKYSAEKLHPTENYGIFTKKMLVDWAEL